MLTGESVRSTSTSIGSEFMRWPGDVNPTAVRAYVPGVIRPGISIVNRYGGALSASLLDPMGWKPITDTVWKPRGGETSTVTVSDSPGWTVVPSAGEVILRVGCATRSAVRAHDERKSLAICADRNLIGGTIPSPESPLSQTFPGYQSAVCPRFFRGGGASGYAMWRRFSAKNGLASGRESRVFLGRDRGRVRAFIHCPACDPH